VFNARRTALAPARPDERSHREAGDAACCLRGSSCCRCWETRARATPRAGQSRYRASNRAAHLRRARPNSRAAPRNLANYSQSSNRCCHTRWPHHIGRHWQPAGSRSPMLPSAVRQVLRDNMGEDCNRTSSSSRSSRRRGVDRTGAQGGVARRAHGRGQGPVPGMRQAMESDLTQLRRVSVLASVSFRAPTSRPWSTRSAPRSGRSSTTNVRRRTRRPFATATKTTPISLSPSDCPARRRSGDRVARRDSARQAHQMGSQPERDRVGILIMRFKPVRTLRCGLL